MFVKYLRKEKQTANVCLEMLQVSLTRCLLSHMTLVHDLTDREIEMSKWVEKISK